MSKYSPLSEYLAQHSQGPITLSFKAIESVLQFELPSSAYSHRAWWANSSSGHSQSQAWQTVGWETTDVDIELQNVTFSVLEYLTPDNGITIDEAKQGLALNFGVSPENIEIIIRG